MKRLKNLFREWLRGGHSQFTVACDYSPWHAPNGRERLFRVRGRKTARQVASNWVLDHPCGQARVIRGWLFWEDEKHAKR